MQKIIIIEPLFENDNFEEKLEEITALCETADGTVVATIKQVIKTIVPATFIGKGKAESIRDLQHDVNADICVFDGELSPSQSLNLTDIVGIPVITRTNLILDIFAVHAKSSEGKILVELAQLKYIYPRLKGKGDSLSRLGAGIGTRGPGETKLETDRRHIKGRILALNKELEKIRSRRTIEYDRRKKNRIKTVVLVGYTNAGKSTLLNLLCKSNDLEMNKLFATLDTSSKKAYINGQRIVFIDTVGFIKSLPEDLLEAFKSTLECVSEADLILSVADSTKNWKEQFCVTDDVLKQLNPSAEVVKVLNKCDVLSEFFVPDEIIKISALKKIGIDNLKNIVIQKLGL